MSLRTDRTPVNERAVSTARTITSRLATKPLNCTTPREVETWMPACPMSGARRRALLTAALIKLSSLPGAKATRVNALGWREALIGNDEPGSLNRREIGVMQGL